MEIKIGQWTIEATEKDGDLELEIFEPGKDYATSACKTMVVVDRNLSVSND